jgi:hypothetical protein
VSAYDQANLLLKLSIAADAAGTAQGTLTVQGANVPECSMEKPEPMQGPNTMSGGGASGGGSGGCAGLDLHALEEASLASE